MVSSPLPNVEHLALRRLRRAGRQLRRTLTKLGSLVGPPARAAAFWSAIALPFLNVALLVGGISTAAETVAFLALLVANALALYVGQPHRR